MSQAGQSSAADVAGGYPVSHLTLVVLLLIPCVVVLLLLNCFFLAYKLLLGRRRRQQRGDLEELLLHSTLRRARRGSMVSPQLEGRRACMSLSEPVLSQPVTSSRASSRAELDHRVRLLRPDGATGSDSLKLPSSIRAASPVIGLHIGSRSCSTNKTDWCRSAPALTQSSDSEAETGVNLVPPNSPMQEFTGLRRSCAYDILTDVDPAAAVHLLDKVDLEYSEMPSEMSCVDTLGSGLDSDFGASAGVSLRILSADSDGLSNGVLSSVLEWDYYDPCYVKQNNLPKHKHHRLAMHTKQYWV
ncbi:protein huluwa [Synchiropus picturatus]